MNNIDKIKAGGIVTIRDSLINMQKQGKKIYRLESGDPSFSVFPEIINKMNQALKEGKTHYTAGAGIIELRKALYRKVLHKNYLKIKDYNSILVTNGAMHGLYILFRALCEDGDQVLMPSPTWTETADNVTLSNGEPIFVSMYLDKNFRYTAENIERFITNKTKAIVINTPHNPSGMISTREEIHDIIDLAKKYDLWIISDEAYEDIHYDYNYHLSPGSSDYDKVISVFSFSKSYAMSGLRLGYVVINDPKIRARMAKLLRCTINGVNSATQWGGLEAVSNDYSKEILKMRNEYSLRRDVLFGALKNTKYFEPFKPEGAFYCWAKISDEWKGVDGKVDDWTMTEYLISKFGIGSSPGSVFGPAEDNNKYIRFAFSCSTDQILDASKILEENM